MAELAVKEFIPYQYEDILTKIKQKFYDKGYTDVNYEGSNANKLASIITGIASDLSFNANANLQEMILSSAYNETNILRGALAQGYERVRRISYQYKVRIRFVASPLVPTNDTTTRVYTINKFDEFTSNGLKYYYMGNSISRTVSNNDILLANSNSYVDIEIKEGNLYKYADLAYLTHVVISVPNGTTAFTETSIPIPWENIEQDGLEIFATYSDGSTLFVDELWYQSQSMLLENINDTKTYLLLEDPILGTYTLHWKYSNSGTDLSEGSVLKMNILTSSGAGGVYADMFATDKIIYMVSADNIELLVTGINQETKSEIAINAPRFNNTANRAVTRKDYVAIASRRPEIAKVSVWGSENEIPKYRKSAFFSYIPSYINTAFVYNNSNKYTRVVDSTFFLTDTEIANINNYYLQYSIPSLKHEHRQPLYIDYDYNVNIVSYNSNKSIYETNLEVNNTIQSYFNTNIENFESVYFNSTLISEITNTTTYISGVTISLDTSINIDIVNLENTLEDDIHYKLVGHLAYPYVYPFDSNNTLILNNLPQIDTTNFITSGDTLAVDFTNMYYYNGHRTFNIKYNGTICGRYIIVKDVEEYIRFELFIVNSETGAANELEYLTTTLDLTDFIVSKKLNLQYINDNISHTRNSIARLSSITFNI